MNMEVQNPTKVNLWITSGEKFLESMRKSIDYWVNKNFKKMILIHRLPSSKNYIKAKLKRFFRIFFEWFLKNLQYF